MRLPQAKEPTVPGAPTITGIEARISDSKVVVLYPRPRTLEQLRDEAWLEDWAVTGR